MNFTRGKPNIRITSTRYYEDDIVYKFGFDTQLVPKSKIIDDICYIFMIEQLTLNEVPLFFNMFINIESDKWECIIFLEAYKNNEICKLEFNLYAKNELICNQNCQSTKCTSNGIEIYKFDIPNTNINPNYTHVNVNDFRFILDFTICKNNHCKYLENTFINVCKQRKKHNKSRELLY